MGIRRLVVIFVMLLGNRYAFSVPQLPCRSAEEYRALIQHLEQRSSDPSASLSDLAAEVPAQCDLTVAGRDFHFSTAQTKTELRAIALAKSGERTVELKQWQESLKRRAERFDAYDASIDPTVKPKLQQIFTRREFSNVGKQDATAILQEQLAQFLMRLLSRIITDPARMELIAHLVVWAVCLVVGGFIIWWLCRWAMRQTPVYSEREVIPFAPSAKNWRDWLNEAQSAVARGELREAVHSGYWAVISQLELSGAWRPDRARTPREYLRLISPTNPSGPLLADITRDFEVIWYGNRVPAVSQWESFLKKVEQIGCR